MDEKVKSALEGRIGQKITPAEAMRLAIQAGAYGTGQVSPNPLVGCTIVDSEHRLLAVGFHARVGGDHAEIHALKQLPDPSHLTGAHVYVTLEPCAHQGRTPSCARTLAPLKPAAVTYAVKDPNPLVSGKGAAILREAGVETLALSEREDIPVEEREKLIVEAEELAEIFLHNQRAREPFVAIKIASSLDGQMALANGESQWITGESARLHSHAIRARYDAVLIGAGTFIADNPSLNVRHPEFNGLRANKAIVLDPRGRFIGAMADANLFKVRPKENVFVVTSPEVKTPKEFAGTHLVCPLIADHEFDLPDLLKALRAHDVHSVMIEGGAATIGAFLKAGKVQRLHAYVAPILIGARNGMAWTRHFEIPELARAVRLHHVRHEKVGEDLYWTGRFTPAH